MNTNTTNGTNGTNGKESLQEMIEMREKEVQYLRELKAITEKLDALYVPAVADEKPANGNGKTTKKRRDWKAGFPTPSQYKQRAYITKHTLVNRVRVAMEKYGPTKLQRLASIVKAPTKRVARVVYNRPNEFQRIAPNTWGKR